MIRSIGRSNKHEQDSVKKNNKQYAWTIIHHTHRNMAVSYSLPFPETH